MGNPNGLVSTLLLLFFNISFHQSSQDRAVRVKKRKPWTNVINNRKNFQILSQFSVVTFFRFFLIFEIGIKCRLILKRKPIYAGEHFILLTPAPVRSRYVGECE